MSTALQGLWVTERRKRERVRDVYGPQGLYVIERKRESMKCLRPYKGYGLLRGEREREYEMSTALKGYMLLRERERV